MTDFREFAAKKHDKRYKVSLFVEVMTGSTLLAIKYERGSLGILDQRLLPHEFTYLPVRTPEDVWVLIRDMAVRGAPAIAIAAVLGLAVDLVSNKGSGAVFATASEAAAYIREQLNYLVTARPTAVNLGDATSKLHHLTDAAEAKAGSTASSVVAAIVAAAEAMLEEDVASNKAIGKHGAETLLAATASRAAGRKVRVLTHCNTGSLATAAYGTALGIVRRLWEDGSLEHAYCTETRPYNQGARLTAFELVYEKIPSTLICDSAACYLMAQGQVDAVVVGADRIVANGDTANKIGTYALAVAAKAHGIPFFVAAPTTSMDPALPSGELIHIEQRPESEITNNHQTGKRVVVDGIGIWNPSFDVTPGTHITGIISEKGAVPRDLASGNHNVRAFLLDLGLVRSDQKLVGGAAYAKAGYSELDEEKVKGYVAARPDLARLVGASGTEPSWTVREVGDGNINFVYIVSGPVGAIVVKQGRPYVRCVGESWPLTQERVRFEAECMKLFFRYCPAHVPEVFHYDERMSVVAMRFIEPPHIILRKGLVEGRVYPRIAAQVGEYLAQTLYNTSLLRLGTDAFRRLQAEYANGDMCRLTEQVIFTEPYFDASNNRWTRPHLDSVVKEQLWSSAELKAAVASLKRSFVEHGEALIHGDLHTGSIMATDESMFVLDAEFAFVGPMGFDIGAFLANILLAYFATDGRAAQEGSTRADQRSFLLEALVGTWRTFERRFRELHEARGGAWGDASRSEVFTEDAARKALMDQYIRGVFEDSLGFAGCKMIRRVVGIAHVEDLEGIVDPAARSVCERRAILSGKQLILSRSTIASIEDVAAAAETIRRDGAAPFFQ